MTIDLARARRETPGCAFVTHFNNAGSALPPAPVVEAQLDYLRREAEIGGYEAVEEAYERIEHVYDAAATLIGAGADEIAVVENATRAWDMAFYSIPLAPGDRILTSVAEYGSNFLAFLQVARRAGVRVDVVPNDETGQLSVPDLANLLDERVKVVAVSHVPTNGGLVQPVAEIGKLTKQSDALFLLDACQSVGQMPVKVEEIGCDMLSTTGRKYLRGPRGTGFLYVRHEVIERLEPPFIDIHAADWVARDRYVVRPDARRFENWETNYAAKVGLATAIDYVLAWGIDQVWERVRELGASLRRRLGDLPGVVVRDRGRLQCGIVTFTIEGAEPAAVRRRLGEQRINVSVSLPIGALLDMRERGLTSLVRASVHYYNSEDEVSRLVEVVEQVSSACGGTDRVLR